MHEIVLFTATKRHKVIQNFVCYNYEMFSPHHKKTIRNRNSSRKPIQPIDEHSEFQHSYVF